jgi:NADP-dependent 3-hydroxy acid dehydrogenase YdfG
MGQLSGKVAWVTGAGTGIGEAGALALAAEGAVVALSGRRAEPLNDVAARIRADHGQALVLPGDLADAEAVGGIAKAIREAVGRLDILVANAGVNVAERSWAELTPEAFDLVVGANLASDFYCVSAVLPMMREQQDGLIIHTASLAGRAVHNLPGPSYTAAKHGVVALSHSINMSECMNRIRSTVILPGDVATPLLDKRPTPVRPEARAKMLQPEHLGDLIRYIACLPAQVCLNEVMITPTWNREYVANLRRGAPPPPGERAAVKDTAT